MLLIIRGSIIHYTDSFFLPEDGRLLGAQIVGVMEGVDKRMDVLATINSKGGTIYDLTSRTFLYHLIQAKDPVNMWQDLWPKIYWTACLRFRIRMI